MARVNRNYWLLLLSVIFVCGLLVGCSAERSTEQGAQSGNASQSGSTAQSSEEPLEITMLQSLFEEVPDMENDFWVEFQKMTNTKLNIEWVPDGDYDTKMELILASGDLPDVMFARNVNSPTIQTAISNGAFWELGQFLGDFSEYPNLKQYSSPLGFRYVTQKGKIIGIPRNRPTIDQGIKIRGDWLDVLGMDVPQTMDEYADYLVAAATQDPDQNGQNDTVGYVHPGGTGIPTNIMAAFGALEPHFNDEGGLIHRDLSDGYTKTVAFMRDVYARGGLPQEFASLRTTQAQELFEAGKAASYQRNIWRAWSFEQNIKKIYPDAEVILIAPEGPEGHRAIRNSPGIFGAHFIASSVPEEKVKRILDFFEYTNTPEFFDIIFYGFEGIHYTVDEEGYKVMTEQGNVEIGTSAQQPTPLAFNNWWKAFDKAAPKQYNDEVWEEVQNWEELGYYDPFEYVVSDTWTNTWPNYQTEWETRVVETIVGKRTMEEYEAYVDELNNRPEFKQAYQEFREYYDDFWAE